MPDTKFQTSFIPKQPVTEEPRRAGGSSIFFLISFLILIVALAAGAGVFIWNKTILKQIKDGNAQLTAHKNAFDGTTIEEFTKLDNRIDVADTLLKSHIGMSGIFPKLQDNTLKTVRFRSFTYTNAGDGKILISMTGEASDYESMALQAQQLTKPEVKNAFQSPIFSNFTKSKDIVVFTFSSGIEPYVIQYYQNRMNAAKETEIGTSSTSVTPALKVESANN